METDAVVRVSQALLYIAVGAALKAVGLLTKADGAVLLKIVFTITLPCLLVLTFATLQFTPSTAVLIALSGVHVAASALSAFWAFGTRPRPEAAILAGSTVGLNLGLFGFPLMDALYGPEGLRNALVFDLPNQAALLLLAHAVFAHFARPTPAGPAAVATALLTRLVARPHPCLAALYLAGTLRAFGAPVPPRLESLMSPLASASKGLSLLALGLLLEFDLRSGENRAGLLSLLGLRYAVALLLGAAAIAALPPTVLPPRLWPQLLMLLTAPVPLLATSYANEFGLDASIPAAAANASVAVSLALCLAGAAGAGAPRGVVAGGAAVLGLGAAAAAAAGLRRLGGRQTVTGTPTVAIRPTVVGRPTVATLAPSLALSPFSAAAAIRVRASPRTRVAVGIRAATAAVGGARTCVRAVRTAGRGVNASLT